MNYSPIERAELKGALSVLMMLPAKLSTEERTKDIVYSMLLLIDDINELEDKINETGV
jgi:hypothetical protein